MFLYTKKIIVEIGAKDTQIIFFTKKKVITTIIHIIVKNIIFVCFAPILALTFFQCRQLFSVNKINC